MSWKYLQGKTWAQVTRDERFFCQHLYNLILRSPDVEAFFKKLDGLTDQKFNLTANAEWEIGYEVCFYRDLWFLDQTKNRYSPKRTFDLCLFSHDQIVIIEAKAQQGFDSDSSQKESFENDKEWVKEATEVKSVKLLGLASSRYLTKKKLGELDEGSLFDALINWKELAEHFDDDEVLLRADSIYDEARLTLSQILERIGRDEKFYIGCQGGLHQFFREFGSDQEKRYEISEQCKNRNWFPSEEVKKHLSASTTTA